MKASETKLIVYQNSFLITSLVAGMVSYNRKIDGLPSTPQTLNDFMIKNRVYNGYISLSTLLSKFGLIKATQRGKHILTMPTAICDNRVALLKLAKGDSWVLAPRVKGRLSWLLT